MTRHINIALILFLLILSGCQSIRNNKKILEDGGTGYYKAIVIENETLPGYTIFSPEKLDYFDDEQKLSTVLWLNENCKKHSDGL